MTKEEIEKEVRQYLRQNFGSECYPDVEMITGYVESRENHIEILKNENAKLKQYIENMYANHCGNCNRNILNTELKNRNQELLESCAGATMMYKDLQKATGIIKELLHALKKEDSDYTFALKNTHPVLVEAEKFIKGETKNE